MARQSQGWIRSFGFRGGVARARRPLGNGGGLPAPDLRGIAGVGAGADLASGRPGPPARPGTVVPDVPDAGCDWAARPEPWCAPMTPRDLVDLASPTRLPGDVSVFHDGRKTAPSLSQDLAPKVAGGGARFGLVLEARDFDGSFVSLVHDLPAEALDGLSRDHYLAVRLTAERERDVEVFARLNVRHGPNLEQMVRQIDFRQSPGLAEFDLAGTSVDDRRIESAWLDLIVESPARTRIALWDLVVLRALRAHV